MRRSAGGLQVQVTAPVAALRHPTEEQQQQPRGFLLVPPVLGEQGVKRSLEEWGWRMGVKGSPAGTGPAAGAMLQGAEGCCGVLWGAAGCAHQPGAAALSGRWHQEGPCPCPEHLWD